MDRLSFYIENKHFLMELISGSGTVDATSGRESFLANVVKTVYGDKACMMVTTQRDFNKRFWFDKDMNVYTYKGAKTPWINCKNGRVKVLNPSLMIQ